MRYADGFLNGSLAGVVIPWQPDNLLWLCKHTVSYKPVYCCVHTVSHKPVYCCVHSIIQPSLLLCTHSITQASLLLCIHSITQAYCCVYHHAVYINCIVWATVLNKPTTFYCPITKYILYLSFHCLLSKSINNNNGQDPASVKLLLVVFFMLGVCSWLSSISRSMPWNLPLSQVGECRY